MNFTLLVVVLLTAIAFVGVVIALSNAISPRSYNAQKFEAFDVETVFLFPWAVIARDLGPQGLISILFFLVVLVLGLAYAWKKGALEWK